MRKHIYAIVPLFLGIICLMMHQIMGSNIAPDGILNRQFGLLFIGIGFIIIGLIISLIIVIGALRQNPSPQEKRKHIFLLCIIIIFGAYLAILLYSVNQRNILSTISPSLDEEEKNTTYMIQETPITIVNGVTQKKQPAKSSLINDFSKLGC